MPTSLPQRYRGHRLTLYQTLAFLVLLGRMRLLDRRMSRLSERPSEQRSESDRHRLRAGARRWLDLSARISAITGIPEPAHAREVRAVFAEPRTAPRSLGNHPPSA